jgi:hypothetical protein
MDSNIIRVLTADHYIDNANALSVSFGYCLRLCYGSLNDRQSIGGNRHSTTMWADLPE